MKIIYDTREQRPLPFKVEGIITEVKKETLNVGDYWCEFEDGYRPDVIYERKSFSDLYGSLSKGYKRFKKEFERSWAQGIRLHIIVEKSLQAVAEGRCLKGKRDIESIVQQAFTICERHRIPIIFTASRWESRYGITHHFMACGREHLRKKGVA